MSEAVVSCSHEKSKMIAYLERIPLSVTTERHTSFYLMQCIACGEFKGTPQGNMDAALKAGVWKAPKKITAVKKWRSGSEETVTLLYSIDISASGPFQGQKLFKLYGGPTGYEGFYLDYKDGEKDISKLLAMSERGWHACMGDSRYPDLVINGPEMKKAFQEYGLI